MNCLAHCVRQSTTGVVCKKCSAIYRRELNIFAPTFCNNLVLKGKTFEDFLVLVHYCFTVEIYLDTLMGI